MATNYPIRVVHLVSTLNIGGLEKVVYDLVRFVDRERFDVKVLCLGEIGALADDFEAIGIPTFGLNAIDKGPLASSRVLARRLKELSVDVLHTHNPAPHLAGALARCRTRIPMLVHTKHGRNYPDQWKRVLINRMVTWATDCVVAVSHNAARVSLEVERIPARKLRVLHNGIDLDRFQPLAACNLNPRRAIHVARLCDPKDHTTLLRAVRLVSNAIPDFHLDLVGDGPHRGQIESLCDELQLRNNVSFAGFCGDVRQRISQCGLALLSSLSEGLSITLLEAMAMGLPVVATNVGGNGEVIVEGQTGMLVPPQQPEKMAAAMLELIGSPERAAAMGKAGRKRIEDEFDLRSVVRAYESIYSGLLAKKLPRHQGKAVSR